MPIHAAFRHPHALHSLIKRRISTWAAGVPRSPRAPPAPRAGEAASAAKACMAAAREIAMRLQASGERRRSCALLGLSRRMRCKGAAIHRCAKALQVTHKAEAQAEPQHCSAFRLRARGPPGSPASPHRCFAQHDGAVLHRASPDASRRPSAAAAAATARPPSAPARRRALRPAGRQRPTAAAAI